MAGPNTAVDRKTGERYVIVCNSCGKPASHYTEADLCVRGCDEDWREGMNCLGCDRLSTDWWRCTHEGCQYYLPDDA